MEQVVYEPESGQLLSASFMEYAMPRAADFCDVHIESSPVPTRLNPLGAKGAGEARHGRRAACRHQRGHGRVGAPRPPRARHACQQRSRLGGHPGREARRTLALAFTGRSEQGEPRSGALRGWAAAPQAVYYDS